MPFPPTAPARRQALRLAGFAVLTSAVAGCGARALAGVDAVQAAGGASTPGGAFLSPTEIHSVDIAMSTADFAATLAAYEADGDKTWVECSVQIDGIEYERCGVRFKGNSTLWRVDDAAAATPSDYPWLIRLDKFVDDQAHHGITDIVVRANNTASSLNEALATDLLARAGLASQGSAYGRVSVAGAAPALRLLMENPSPAWLTAALGADGMLYKAEASANYDYLGDDPARYAERFDQEAGPDDLTPLIAFLKWANQSNDNDFRAELPDRLDVDAFATYLAFEDLVDNYDAIDGPGNNSYLFHDPVTTRMTVVAWDHNLTFGVTNRPGGQGGRGGPPGGAGGGAAPERRGNQTGNVLSRRFRSIPSRAKQIDSESARLRADLYASGYAATRLDALATLVAGTGLVDAAALAREKASIAAYLTA